MNETYNKLEGNESMINGVPGASKKIVTIRLETIGKFLRKRKIIKQKRRSK
jgi:hypothetical protein